MGETKYNLQLHLKDNLLSLTIPLLCNCFSSIAKTFHHTVLTRVFGGTKRYGRAVSLNEFGWKLQKSKPSAPCDVVSLRKTNPGRVICWFDPGLRTKISVTLLPDLKCASTSTR